ncbi:MAG: transporter substrate-binding protein [Sphingomonas bacterium]|uniref:penicillin-binding protein activator n=1 Tax=Sphingomonas bacterium TaxID=1895847 RepID=UPI00262517A1|nr:penicillin-binding protein activator [Sphingomonas bacterium]MDB5710011.1 transporter substrate-binding protein [Sphingomonas bacterium]
MAEASAVPQRASTIWRTAIVAAALILSGCQSVVPRGRPAPIKRPPVTRPVPVQQPVVEQGIPTDTERHRIALLVPLTGANAGVGQSLANATQLALLDTRNERLRVTTYDTNTGAAAAAQRAIADGNKLILGPLLAADVRAVMPVARGAGVPVISFSNDAGVAGNGAYLMGNLPTQSIGRVVDYAQTQGVTTFAGLVPNGLYGERASTGFLRAVEAGGGKVVSLQVYAQGTLAGAVGKLGQAGPYQALLVADNSAAASGVVALVRRAGGGGAHILGTDQWNLDAALAAKAPLNGAWFASVSDNLYRQYAAKYRARFGTAPFRLSSMGYDAVLLTIRIARDWPIGRPFPEERLRDRDGFAGLDGAFRFGRDGTAERALEVQEIRGGTTVVVSPAPSGF